ncbi:MAG: Ig-like domain-containing protein [Bacilli bacterium]|nr:Ig-like domain-containing protein [Bacilli bacterium]
MKKSSALFALASMALLVSCGGGNTTSSTPAADSGSGGTTTSSVATEEKIVLTIDKATIKVGETAKVTSSVEGVTFSSRDESVATVDANGTVTALKAGTTKIQARKEGYKLGSIDITVEKADARTADFYLEFEDADHYDPDGVWGYPQWGIGPGDSPIEETEFAHGGKSVGWFTQGCKETIFFNSDKAGTVEMDFMMAYNAEMALEGVIKITVNGVELSLAGKSVLGPEDGSSYYDFNSINFKDVAVKEGENTIVVEALGQGPNMDCVQVYTKELKIAQIIKTAPKATSLEGATLDYLVEGFEWGPAITGLLVHFPGEVSKNDLGSLTAKTNNVDRTITAAYLSDASGATINAEKGTIARLDLEVRYVSNNWGGGDSGGSSPFTYSGSVNNWTQNMKMSVGIASGKSVKIGATTYGDDNPTVIDAVDKRIVLSTRDWGEAKSFTADGKTLTYKAYSTEALTGDGVKNPLVIWLHGAGEGGTDPDIALLGNDVTNLGEEKIQNHFVQGNQKGAYVLAVQTPTMWMDRGSGQYTDAGESIYTLALKATIDHYLTENTDVNTDRIFLGGCSNGGFMTMNMAIKYPTFFKAYYPVCEAYADSAITDDNIASLKNLSIWFTHAANDTTVNPANYTVATYKRLMAAGAQDVHFSFFENVLGTEGNPNGRNSYMGHYSWIYTLKDECLKDQADPTNVSAPSTADVLVGGQAVSLWGWLASK